MLLYSDSEVRRAETGVERPGDHFEERDGAQHTNVRVDGVEFFVEFVDAADDDPRTERRTEGEEIEHPQRRRQTGGRFDASANGSGESRGSE